MKYRKIGTMMNCKSQRSLHFWLASCVLFLATTNLLQAAEPAPKTRTVLRIVRCDQQVQSKKRGICANRLYAADFAALAPGVSWWYNWYFTTTDPKPKNVPMEFLPMAWGNRPEDLAGLERYLAAGNKPRQILAINEPNLRGQAFITPEQTATLYAKIKAIADRYHMPVSGPQMALGSATADSITATDPIEKKQVTYTFMVPFEKAFLHYARKTDVRVTSLHRYGNLGEMRWGVDLMHKEFKRPVWVTEYAHVPNAKEGLIYLMQATDFLERTPYVEGYAWFKERSSDASFTSALLAPEPGKLTTLGAAYVAMPVHDAELYYRLPGRLQAESYVRMNHLEIWPTTDDGGFAQMTANEPGATLAYNIYVEKPGTYKLGVRVTGEPGTIEILSGSKVLASVATTSTTGSWQTVNASVALPAGAQTIHVRCTAKGQTINWIEFAKP